MEAQWYVLAVPSLVTENKMEELTIRKARKEDCPRLLELIRELALYEKAPEEVTVTPGEFEQAGFGDKPVWWAFVAENEHTIVGFALYYIRYSTWKGCRMYLEDLIVTEQYRWRGVGKLLFDELIREAKQQKFKGITWQVLDWNEPAIRFYKKYNAELSGEWLNGHISEEQLIEFNL